VILIQTVEPVASNVAVSATSLIVEVTEVAVAGPLLVSTILLNKVVSSLSFHVGFPFGLSDVTWNAAVIKQTVPTSPLFEVVPPKMVPRSLVAPEKIV